MKYKILYVISSLKSCGPDNVLLDIIKGIDRNKFDISVLALSRTNSSSIEEELINLNVKIYFLELSRFEIFFIGLKKIKKILDIVDPAIIHTHCIRSTYFLSKIKTKAKKFVTIHNYPHVDYVYTYGWFIGSLASRVFLYSLLKYDEIIACSESISIELKRKFNIDSLFIRNGVREVNINVNKSELRYKLNIPNDKIVVICVGNLTEGKNSVWLTSALGKLDNRYYSIFLGDGPKMDECVKLKKENIAFKGNVRNVNEYLAAADVLVSASKAEGLPLSVLESLSEGVPVVLSNIAPHLEIINSYNNIGLTFDIDDEIAFINKINYISEDSILKEFSLNAKKAYKKYFTSSIMADKYQQLYKLNL